MDFRTFRVQYDALEPVRNRAAFLLDYAEEAMQICPEELAPLLVQTGNDCLLAGLPGTAAHCGRLLGWIALDKADFPSALERFEQTCKTFEQLGDEAGRLRCLNGIASVHMGQGRFEASLVVYREALTLAEGLGDPGQVLIILANIGEGLTELRQFNEAIPYLRRALDSGTLSPLNQALVLSQLGMASLGLGRVAEARDTLGQSAALARRGGFLPTLAQTLGRLGALELSQGDAGAAAPFLEESRAVARRSGDRVSEVRATVDLGRVQELKGVPGEAWRLYSVGLELARALGTGPLETEAWKGLASASKALGHWKEALDAFEHYHDLSLRLGDEAVTRQLAQLKADQNLRETTLLREQTRILALLGDLGQKITSSLDLETIVLEVYQGIGSLMRAETFGLGLYREDRNTIDYRLVIEDGVRLPPIEGMAEATSFSGWALKNRRELLLNDVRKEWDKYLPAPPPRFGDSTRETRSGIFLPLVAEDKILGILTAQSYATNAYTDRDLATLKTLGASISVAVQNARLFDRVNKLATIDSLTGAATRRHLFERAEEEFQRYLRDSQPLALVMIDLDHFKELNDRWGHAVGDRVLADFGALCLAGKRPHDLFGRYGGEEFALLLSGSTLDGAMATAERLCQEVRAMPLEARPGEPLTLTASFGVTVFDPADREITRVFSRADEALYEAKQTGRDRVAARTV